MNVHTTKVTRLVLSIIGLDESTKGRVWVFTLRTNLDSTDPSEMDILLLQSFYRDENKFQLERCLHRVPNNVKWSYERVFNVRQDNCIHDCLTVLNTLRLSPYSQTRTHLNTFVCACIWHCHPRDRVVVYTHNYNSREMHHVTLMCGVTVASW